MLTIKDDGGEKMSSSNASATLFGWDFQINAAIVLMLDNIQIAEQVRVEGDTEDIEIKLSNGKMLYSQAKSVEKSTDYSHVKDKLKKALTTLSTASENPDCDKLIYVTNSPNPFGDKKSMAAFYGHTRKAFKNLPDTCRTTVENIIDNLPNNTLDTDKFHVHVIPFETDDMKERYKVIKTVVDDFVFSVKPNLSGIGQQAMEIWQKDFFENATLSDTSKTIKKKELIWPLIVLMYDSNVPNNPILEIMDESDLYELTIKYKDLINNKVERFDFSTKIISDYKDYKPTNMKTKTIEFINLHWLDYKDEFDIDGVDPLIQEKVLKIIIDNIIRQKYLISDIKKKVCI